MALGQVGQVGELHAEAQVGFVRTVLLHRLDPRHAAQRLGELDAQYVLEHVLGPALEDLEDVLLLDERHLAVDLREFGLTVGAQVFVAEAAHDLEILVVSGYHEQLLERLRRLGQGVELVGVHAARHHEVAGTLGRGAHQVGGFDLEETLGVEEAADLLGHLVAQDHVALQGRTPQVEVAVFHAQVVAAVRILLDGEGGRLRLVEHRDLLGHHLDVARGHLGVLGLALDDATRDLEHPLASHAGGHLADFGCRVLLDRDLRQTVAVAQVDECHGAEVSHFLHPPGEGDGLVYVAGSQTAARMGSVHGRGCIIVSFFVFLSLQPTKVGNLTGISCSQGEKSALRLRKRAQMRPPLRIFRKHRPQMEQPTQQSEDERFMRQALGEARKALEAEEVPIGAVVVSGGRVVGRGHNLVETLGDPTAHAEMQALTAAASTLGGKYLPDCTLYVTVEPCIMCAGAIAWAQVGRVVWGADDAKKGYRRYSESVFHPKTGVTRGVLAAECEELMTSFFAFLRR